MIKAQVAEYLEKALLFEFNDEITESTDLFKAGIVDSFSYIQLMKFVQEKYAIRFSKGELLSNITTTLTGIVALIEAKLDESERAVV